MESTCIKFYNSLVTTCQVNDSLITEIVFNIFNTCIIGKIRVYYFL